MPIEKLADDSWKHTFVLMVVDMSRGPVRSAAEICADCGAIGKSFILLLFYPSITIRTRPVVGLE